MNPSPTLAQIIEDAIENRLVSLNTMLPGEVVTVDVAAGKCDVRPLIKRKYGDETVVNMPIITNVPIANYRAGSAFISLPVKVGDYVELRFSQRSLDLWLSKGGSVDPLDPRKFHISDAVAYPGMYPFTNPPSGASADNIVIKNGSTTLVVTPAELQLFGSGDAIALASLVLERLNAMKMTFDTHVHPGVEPGAGSTGVSATPMAVIDSVASTKVKAE